MGRTQRIAQRVAPTALVLAAFTLVGLLNTWTGVA